jgi:hypothetical protein
LAVNSATARKKIARSTAPKQSNSTAESFQLTMPIATMATKMSAETTKRVPDGFEEFVILFEPGIDSDIVSRSRYLIGR